MPPAEKVSHARMPNAVVKGARDGLALTSPGCREHQACLGLDTPHQDAGRQARGIGHTAAQKVLALRKGAQPSALT